MTVTLFLGIVATVLFQFSAFSQSQPKGLKHAEPLYMDLVCKLGAHKGEKEVNIGADFTNLKHYNEHNVLAEIEFAPINNLAFEAEVDFSFIKPTRKDVVVPQNKMESLRLSTMYSFYANSNLKLSMAAGYTQIFEMTEFRNYGKENLINATVYNPFFVASKIWGNDVHTTLYYSPMVEQHFEHNKFSFHQQVNASIQYVIPNTNHFVGVEFNQTIGHLHYDLTIRPQVKIQISKNMAVGLVFGIPTSHKSKGYSTFFRFIYEL